VTNLEEGCYYYAPKAQELRQIRFKNFRRELHYLCLGQELGRDAGAVVFHTADLEKAVKKKAIALTVTFTWMRVIWDNGSI
jgi:hypothetical protein